MKQFICTGTWRRNNKGDIITEQEYNKMPIEAKEHNYKEYIEPVFAYNLSIGDLPAQEVYAPTGSGNIEDLKKSWRSTIQTNKDEE